ncbi:MAG: iron ABC transporter permease [Alphaproteobacteria bacterium]|nr:iron ABC transporter permease [Alphaproteobacteria bacterium]
MRALGVRSAFPFGVTLIAFILLALFLIYPLAQVLVASLLDPTGTTLTFANYGRVLGIAFYRAGLINSLTLGAGAAAISVVVGVPMAFCLARLPIVGRNWLLAIAALPLVLPSFVGAYAWVMLLGRSGIVTQALASVGLPSLSIYGMPGLTLVFALHSFPYVLLPTVAAFKAIDQSMEEASLNLGATRIATFWRVQLPIALPAVLAGALLVFVETIENFGVPFLLAEDRPILAVQAYKLFVGEVGANPASAGVLSMLLVFCTVAALLVQRRYLARRRFSTAARSQPPELVVGAAGRIGATVYCWGMVLLALVPFAVVVVISFMPFRGPVLHPGFTIDNFIVLIDRASRPLLNTLGLASAATLAATLVGLPIGYVLVRYRSALAGILDSLSMTPLAVAGTVLGIGFVLAFNAGWLVLTGGWLVLAIVYAVRKLPFNVRAASAILHQIEPSLEEASINLGVSPARTFVQLTLPLMIGGVVGGMVLTWVAIVSELSATIVLYSGPWATMTIVMFQALEGGSPGVASAAATVLIAVTLVPLLLVYRLLRRHELSLT